MATKYISEKEKEILQFMDKATELQKYLYSIALAQERAMADKVLKEHDFDSKEYDIDIKNGKFIKK